MPFKKDTFFQTTRITVLLVAAAAILCLISIAGWVFNFETISPIVPGFGWTGMKVNTSIGLLVAACSLLLPAGGFKKNIKEVLAVFVILLGVITLSEYIFHWNAGIDELFFKEKTIPAGLYPGRMIPMASLGFIFLGITLLLYSLNKKSLRKIADASAILMLAISFIALAGYLYNVSSLYRVKGFDKATFPGTLSFLMLPLAVLFSNPETGLIAVFNEKTKAAKTGTFQVIFIISILLVIGWLTLQGYAAGLYDTQFGISIMITVFIVSFFFVIKYGIRKLNESEKEKEMLHKQDEEKAAFIKDIFERVNDPFIALDKNWNFTYINKKAGALTMRNPKDLIGKNIWEEFPQAVNSETYHAFKQAMTEQQYTTNTEFFAPLNLWHEDSIYPSPEGLSIYVRDITEKKKAEKALKDSQEKYRSLFENSPDGILLTVPEGKILAANAAACSMFGMTEKEIIEAGRNGIVDISDPNLPLLIKERFDTGKAKGELTFLRKDGSKFPGEITSAKFKDASGEERSSMIIRDISERKKADEALTKSKVLLNEAQRIAHIGSWELELDSNKLIWSDEIYRIFEIEPDKFEASYETFLSLIHPDDKEMVNAAYKNSLETKTPYSIEHRLKFGNNRIKYVLEQCETFYDEAGKPIRSLGIIQDITDRKKAQQALAESERRLSTIFQTEPECIKLLNEKGELLDMNQAGLAMIEADSLEMVKRKSVLDFVVPEYRKAFSDLTQKIFSGESGTLEFQITGLRGTHRWMETHAVPFKDRDGNIISLLSVTRDVSEKKIAQDKLIESEMKYRTLMEKAGDSIILFNSKGQLLEANESALHLLDYSSEEYKKMSLADFVFEEDLKAKPFLLDLLDKGESTITVRRLKKKDGTAVVTEIHSKKLTDDRYLGVARDLTERIKAEKELNEKDIQLREISASIPGFIYQFIMSPDGEFHFSYIGESVKALIGITPGEAYENVGMAFAKVHADDLPGLFESINKSAQTLKPWSYTFRTEQEDTTIRWLRGNSIPQKREDGSILWNGAIFDITELKKAEESIRKNEKKFRDLLEATPDAMVIVNEDGLILMTNHQAENIFGYTREELFNQRVEMLMPDSFRNKHKEQRHGYVTNPAARSMGKSLDLIAKKKNGTIFPVEISLSPLITEEGMFISAAIRDITERKAAAAALEESYQSIRRLTEHLQNVREEERTSIAREIHDELGQQLTVMMMDVSWLEKRVPADNEIAHKKIDDLLKLMENTVKTVRRISSELRPSVLDDLGLVVAMDLQLKELEKRSGICTKLIAPKREPVLPVAVKNGMFRIFQESLTNVARHSGASKVIVTFENKNGKIVLTIKDNGSGFDEKKAAEKRTLGVLGMKERANVMGGEYLISGEPGKGTTIVVSVPVNETVEYTIKN